MTALGAEVFEAAYGRVAPHIHHTHLMTSRILSERTGFDVRAKTELYRAKTKSGLSRVTLP